MSEIELKAYEQGKQDARAEIEQASDASLTDADVERLAKVIRAAAAKECGCDENSYGTGIFIVEARAALAWMKENGQ